MPGPLQHSPARVIQALLVDQGFGTDSEDTPNGDWPIFDNYHPDTPDSVIKISDTQGRNWGTTQVDGELQEMQGIQILVRSADKEEGYRKAQAIAIYINATTQPRVTLEGVGTASETVDYVVHSIDLTGSVIPLGAETPSSKRFLFTVNALCTLRMCC